MKNQRLILLLSTVGVIVVILIALLSTLLATKKLTLTNFDQIKTNLSSHEVNELENFIWQSLQYTQGFSDNANNITALVRPSSFSQVTKDNITNYNFLVDIDAYQATYSVSFALVQGKGFYESPIVDCPAPEQMKYPSTTCQGEKTSTLSVTVGRSLPYYFNLDSGELVTVTRSMENDNSDYLNVRVSSCGNKAVIETAKSAISEWIKSLGYDPAKYQIKIPEYCDGSH